MNPQSASTTQSQRVVPRVAGAVSRFSRSYRGLLASLGITAFLLVSAPALAASAPPLGAAASFSVLAGLSMSAAGAGTSVSGDLGLSPGLAVSWTGPWTVGGTTYFGPLSLAGTAQTAALGAFNNLAGQGSSGAWAASPWGPGPGVWTVAADTTFAGTITLSGNSNDVWVFQVGRDMTFSGTVALTGNAQACNVFWQIGRDATIASGSTFVGTLIASRNVIVASGATVNGRIISLTGSLTTDGNAITGPTCVAAPPITGSVQVCKVAGAGVAVGTNFAFNVAGTPVTVAAGAAPGGTCGAPVTLPTGTAVITETIPAGTVLTGVSTLPSAGLLVSSNLGAGTATVTVNAGATTIVTFTDASTNGSVQVCKVAGGGVAVGTNFSFLVAGTPQTVPAGAAPDGTCGTPVTVPTGTAVITETIPAGIVLTGVSTLPSAGLLVSSNLVTGTATVTVNAGGRTIVTFTDVARGSITILKKTDGGNGTFNYTGAQAFSITTVGGNGSNTTAFASVVPNNIYVVTETPQAGWSLTQNGLICSNGSIVNVGTATANVAVAPGEAVTCTFTNMMLLSPVGIPTLAEWALIMLAMLLLVTGWLQYRRRQ